MVVPTSFPTPYSKQDTRRSITTVFGLAAKTVIHVNGTVVPLPVFFIDSLG